MFALVLLGQHVSGLAGWVRQGLAAQVAADERLIYFDSNAGLISGLVSGSENHDLYRHRLVDWHPHPGRIQVDRPVRPFVLREASQGGGNEGGRSSVDQIAPLRTGKPIYDLLASASLGCGNLVG